MTQQADDVLPGGQSAFGALQQRVLHTEDRLAEIKTELRELNTSVKELNATIAAMGKPHFQTWAAIGGLVASVSAGAWWLAITPLKDHLAAIDIIDATVLPREESVLRFDQLKGDIQRLESDMKNKASKDDLNQKVFELIQRSPKK